MATQKLSVCMVGTGEYTTGYVGTGGSASDKKVGVIGLCMFELRRLGLVDGISMVGTTGHKYDAIRRHLQTGIADVYGLDTACATYPADDVAKDYEAYKTAIDALPRGAAITIFTPDDTHFSIAKYAISRGLHVLVTKPATKTLAHHRELVELAQQQGVLVMVEFHKRWDPIYIDAKRRMGGLGDFGFFNSYMSQPKFQLDTFKAWAGKSSDISYYLNSHHIDVHAWAMRNKAHPVSVTAMAATGVASGPPYYCPKGSEDTITVMSTWKNDKSGNLGTASYTASWSAAAKSEVHSQQRYHYVGHTGEVKVDQAHRGYEVWTDDEGYKNVNPLYMAYSKDEDGNFSGHHGYGYKSIEAFTKACIKINSGLAVPADFDRTLPTLATTATTTAILEAGRRSLDHGHRPVYIVYDDDHNPIDLTFDVPAPPSTPEDLAAATQDLTVTAEAESAPVPRGAGMSSHRDGDAHPTGRRRGVYHTHDNLTSGVYASTPVKSSTKRLAPPGGGSSIIF